MTTPLDTLRQAIQRVCSEEQSQWLAEAIDGLRPGTTADELATLIARARRRVGRQPLGESAEPIDTPDGPLAIARWEAGDAARVALLLAAIAASGGSGIVKEAYRLGDDAENTALIRGLSLYGDGEALRETALNAGRTNSLLLLAALTLHNPYPAAHYADHEFNQMVLKALFLGLNIDAVQGLERRGNPELSQMCEDYIDERLAAGRSVPADIWLALAPHASAAGLERLQQALQDDSPEHRYYAARATGRRPPTPALSAAIERQLQHETDPRIRRQLLDTSGKQTIS